MPDPAPLLYAYDDYRAFLRDWYQHMKRTRRGFSYRSFAKHSGFHTSNFLLLVTQGKRNLTESSLRNMSKGLGLNKQEEEFFRHLVFFNQAKSPEERQEYFARLHQSKQYRAVKPIEHWQYEYYSQWYHPVIRELICAPGFDGTPHWLAKQLYPSVTPAQCAKSLALLQHLGFIRQNATGRWEQTSTLISTGPRLTSLVVHNYHKTMLELAKHLMDHLPNEARDVSTLTVGISRAHFPMIREKIRAFRQDILSLTANDTAPDDVVQLCIQYFPLARVKQ